MVFFSFYFWFSEEALGFLGFDNLVKKKKNGGVLLGRCCLMRFDAARTVALVSEGFLQGQEAREDGVAATAAVDGDSSSMSSYQHRSFREFTCWGSADFRRPPGKFFPSLYTRLLNTVSYINLYLWLGLYHHELCWMGFSFFGWGVRLVRSVGFIGFDLISFGDI